MTMEQRMNDPTGWIWFGFTCLLAVTLAVNGMQALFGTAKFAYWHIGTLVAGYMMTRATLTDVQLASVQRLWEYVLAMTRKVAKPIVMHIRAVFAAFTALFTAHPFNRPQTEP